MSIPIAVASTNTARWGLKQHGRRGRRPTPTGYLLGRRITEMLKICFASTYDLPVIPHGHSTPASAHLIASQPTATSAPEYLAGRNEIHQFS